MSIPNHCEETIAAIATAVSAGQGGVAIVRISGQNSEVIAKNIIDLPGKQQWESHKVLYGFVRDQVSKETIDEVLVLPMKAPRSFTGEDVVEIHCHAGLISVQRILNKILLQPHVRRAMPGEFSERAVINGRLTLTQAEAISDLIAARSERGAKLAMAGVCGETNKTITSLRNRLLDQLCELEARVDFEEDLPPLNQEKLLDEISSVFNSLDKLIADSERSRFIRKGIKVSIIGLPNVGKSSILNFLSKTNRAIVTDTPGTTRDLVEISLILNGVPVTLIDTAGIRSATDQVEEIGIKKSFESIKFSDVVLFVFDMSMGWSKSDQDLLNKIPIEIPRCIVGNKSDLCSSNYTEKMGDVIFNTVNGKGEDQLIKILLETCGTSNLEGLGVTLNERQLDLAMSARSALHKTKNVALQELPWDFWTIDLRDAIHKLGELSGEEITETLLDRIFSRFCIGK